MEFFNIMSEKLDASFGEQFSSKFYLHNKIILMVS